MTRASEVAARRSAWAVFAAFLRLGCTSFGGPVAHLGYFRTEFVERRKWLAESAYAEMVALCQFLPGPASSQVGMAIGLSQAGAMGMIGAWAGFTLPSAAAMTAFAYGANALGGLGDPWLHGLKVAAVAVVAQAVWGMARTLAPDRPRATLAVGAALLALFVPSAWGQIAGIVAGGAIGARWLAGQSRSAGAPLPFAVHRGAAVACLAAFFALLALLPLLRNTSHVMALADSFYRTGALVFGGGHVMLPLLQSEVIAPGWISSNLFLAGYGAAQAIPGPLSTFAAYLGAAMTPEPRGLAGAGLCLVAIFLPSGLLVAGVLPFWETVRERRTVQAALAGINAAVVGLLLTALYQPVWTGSIARPADFALALTAFLLLQVWRVPPWLVVILSACAGAALA
ncbi:MAG: chromate efflux transporter [SAR324 cluster bacterium]